MLKILLLVIALLVGAVIAYFELPPLLSANSPFIKTCKSLNGSDLNLTNINKLNGWCHGGSQKCIQEYIDKLKNSTDPFHNISEKNEKDGTWACNVSVVSDNKIKATPLYIYE